MNIAFDVGGVLSKYESIRELYYALTIQSYNWNSSIKTFVISDMYPVEKIEQILVLNKLPVCHNVYSADYKTYGENCKKVLCDKLQIDIIIDDFMGYLAEGNYTRLLVMPDPNKSYYSDDWKTDGTEGDFGRRKKI